MIKITYNSRLNVTRILFGEAPIQTSEKRPNGVSFYFDASGRIVGLEIPSTSSHNARPPSLELAALGER